MSCVVLASSGTGGHVFPALALAAALKRQDPDIRIVFVRAGHMRFDDKFPDSLGDTRWLPAIGMPRRFSVKLPLFLLQTVRSLLRSLRIMRECKPDVVVGFGNFGSYGPLRAAVIKRIPVFLHEGNMVAGKANRMLGKYAALVGVNYPDAAKSFHHDRIEVVGMPIRNEFNAPRQRREAIKYFGLAHDALTLLVSGGSQGAHSINEVVRGMLPRMRSLNLQVIHLTGVQDYESVSTAYSHAGVRATVKAFEEKMKRAFDAADLMISRSGASSLSEISATGKPAILVPFPFATDNHQFHNAKYLADRDAAEILEDKHMTIGSLFSKLESLVRNEERRKQLSVNSSKLYVGDSAEKMAKTVLGLARQRGK